MEVVTKEGKALPLLDFRLIRIGFWGTLYYVLTRTHPQKKYCFGEGFGFRTSCFVLGWGCVFTIRQGRQIP